MSEQQQQEIEIVTRKILTERKITDQTNYKTKDLINMLVREGHKQNENGVPRLNR